MVVIKDEHSIIEQTVLISAINATGRWALREQVDWLTVDQASGEMNAEIIHHDVDSFKGAGSAQRFTRRTRCPVNGHWPYR